MPLLRFSLQSLDGDAPPTEFRLLAPGSNPYRKDGMDAPGQIAFDADAADAIIKRFSESGRDRMAIDYDHSTFNDRIAEKPAAGWFVPEVRNGELWATKVKWTPRAAEYLKNGEYRFFSPTVELDADGRAMALRPVALTNDPALCNLQPLVAANAAAAAKGAPMKLLLKALDLAEDAEEAAALDAVNRLGGFKAQLLALSGKSTVEEAIGALTAIKAQAEKAEALAVELSAVKAEKAQAEVKAMLDEAVADGRVAPAKRAELEKMHAEHGVAALRTCLSMLPKAAAPVEQPKEDKMPTATASGLTAEQLEIIKKAGLTVEKFTAHRDAYRAIKPGDEK